MHRNTLLHSELYNNSTSTLVNGISIKCFLGGGNWIPGISINFSVQSLLYSGESNLTESILRIVTIKPYSNVSQARLRCLLPFWKILFCHITEPLFHVMLKLYHEFARGVGLNSLNTVKSTSTELLSRALPYRSDESNF